MAVLDRHRVARLVELSALEYTAKGAERLLHEETVAFLVKGAYDDATEPARAEFMARVKTMPETAWPWSTVQSMAPRGGGGGGGGSYNVNLAPKPGAIAPAALILIRGQADSADVDPGNRLPDRGTAEAAVWEPLYKALDNWDTKTILARVGPQGWVSGGGANAGQPKDTGNGAPSGGVGTGTNGDKGGNGGGGGTGDLPAPVPPTETALTWKHPAVIVTGAAVVFTAGVVIYNVSQNRSRQRLEAALSEQEEQT